MLAFNQTGKQMHTGVLLLTRPRQPVGICSQPFKTGPYHYIVDIAASLLDKYIIPHHATTRPGLDGTPSTLTAQ